MSYKKNNYSHLQHCGKVFENTTKLQSTSIDRHMRICRLERSNCDCNDISFSTAHEKRRHMLLFHSNKKYFSCSECNFVSRQQKVVDHHYRHYHGLPGQEEVCDLCLKTFKSKNHLRIHGFNHEVFYQKKRISISTFKRTLTLENAYTKL